MINFTKEKICNAFKNNISDRSALSLAIATVNKIDKFITPKSIVKIKILTGQNKSIVFFLDKNKNYVSWNPIYNNAEFLYYKNNSEVSKDCDLLISKRVVDKDLYCVELKDSEGGLIYKYYEYYDVEEDEKIQTYL